MSSIFIGSGVALITPFDKDGKINFDAFRKLIEFQIANKTDAIIVCGTTGEGSTLSVEERLKLFSVAAKVIEGRVPLICGTGSNSTSFSCQLIYEAEQFPVDAHLCVTPYYNKASQTGIIRHYYALADKASKPVIVYNVPSRTGVNILPETYEALSGHGNIKAVKEADPDIVKLQHSIYKCGDRLDFYIGNDDLIAPGCMLGCKGVISVLANILPYYTHNLALRSIAADKNTCLKLQGDAMELISALFSDVNPIPVKAAAKHLYGIDSTCRLPLCPTDKVRYNKLIMALENSKALFSTEKQKTI